MYFKWTHRRTLKNVQKGFLRIEQYTAPCEQLISRYEIQPQLINDVTPGTRHLRINKPTRLIQHNRPSNNASAASYKPAEASIASWDALGDELPVSLVCSMPDCVEAVIKAKGGHTRF